MGDSDANGNFALRRRATFAAGRGASLSPLNGRSAAGSQRAVTADMSGGNGEGGKRDLSLETIGSKAKSEKKKRRNDISERLR